MIREILGTLDESLIHIELENIMDELDAVSKKVSGAEAKRLKDVKKELSGLMKEFGEGFLDKFFKKNKYKITKTTDPEADLRFIMDQLSNVINIADIEYRDFDTTFPTKLELIRSKLSAIATFH